MTNPRGESTSEQQLEPGAAKALRELIADLRESLLSRAAEQSNQSEITEEALYEAYRQFAFPSQDELVHAGAQRIVSQALQENRAVEWVSYAMAIALFLFGMTLFSVGVFHGDAATRISAFTGGAVVEILIILPFRFAINSRKHNMALRMLAIVLDRVKDPKMLAPLLKETFFRLVLDTSAKNLRSKDV